MTDTPRPFDIPSDKHLGVVTEQRNDAQSLAAKWETAALVEREANDRLLAYIETLEQRLAELEPTSESAPVGDLQPQTPTSLPPR